MASTPGYITDKQALRTRLQRVEGQVRGLQRQVEKDTSWSDLLSQVAGATTALEGVALLVLDQQLQQCVTDATDPVTREQKLTETGQVIARFVRS